MGYSPWGHTASAAGWIRGAYRPTDSFTATDLLWGPLKLWGKSPGGRRGPEARYKAEQSVSRRRLPPQGRGQPGSSAGQEGTMLHPLQGSCARETDCVFAPLVLLSPALGPFVFAPFLGKAVPRLPPCQVQQQHPYFARLRHGALALWVPRGQKPEQLWLQASSHQEDT